MSTIRFIYETSLCLKCGESQSTVLVKFGDLYKARKLVDCCDGYFNICLDDGSVFDGVLGEIFENVCGKVPVEKIAEEEGVLVEKTEEEGVLAEKTEEEETWTENVEESDDDDVEYVEIVKGDDIGEVSLDYKDNDRVTLPPYDIGVDKICLDGIDIEDDEV
jgi:hypothetical protein